MSFYFVFSSVVAGVLLGLILTILRDRCQEPVPPPPSEEAPPCRLDPHAWKTWLLFSVATLLACAAIGAAWDWPKPEPKPSMQFSAGERVGVVYQPVAGHFYRVTPSGGYEFCTNYLTMTDGGFVCASRF